MGKCRDKKKQGDFKGKCGIRRVISASYMLLYTLK
jgi:hypothetical protein